MHEQGASLREIARALGVSHDIVSRWLQGQYKVLERSTPYAARPPRTRRRPLGAPLLSCGAPAR
jgi:transposase